MEDEVTRLLERAEALLDSKRPAAATITATQALAAAPDEFHCRAVLARCQAAAGFPDQAVTTARQAIAIDPGQPGPYLTASRASSTLRQYSHAVGFAREAVRLLPESPAPHCRLAITLAKQYAGRSLFGVLTVSGLREAASSARQAISLAPEEHGGHFAAGFVAMATRRRRAARKHYRRALAICPDDPGTLNNLAALGLNGWRLGRSGAGFASALAADPTLALARANVSLHIYTQLVAVHIVGWLGYLAFFVTAEPGAYRLAWNPRCSVAAALLGGYASLVAWVYRRQDPGVRAFGRSLVSSRRPLWWVAVADLAMVSCFWLATLGRGGPAVEIYQLGLLAVPLAALPIAVVVRQAKKSR